MSLIPEGYMTLSEAFTRFFDRYLSQMEPQGPEPVTPWHIDETSDSPESQAWYDEGLNRFKAATEALRTVFIERELVAVVYDKDAKERFELPSEFWQSDMVPDLPFSPGTLPIDLGTRWAKYYGYTGLVKRDAFEAFLVRRFGIPLELADEQQSALNELDHTGAQIMAVLKEAADLPDTNLPANKLARQLCPEGWSKCNGLQYESVRKILIGKYGPQETRKLPDIYKYLVELPKNTQVD